MDRISAKRNHLKGLKGYAQKGIASELKSKYGPPPEAAAHPEPDMDQTGGPSDGDADNVPHGAKQHKGGLEDVSTEELMAVLKERLGSGAAM